MVALDAFNVLVGVRFPVEGPNNFETRFMIDYQYCGVDYEYSSGSYNCTCEGICRCSTISNAHITSVNPSGMVEKYVSHNKIKSSVSEIEKYCIERIFVCHQVYLPEKWDIGICNGYYGQEVGSVTLYDEHSVYSDIDKMLNLKSDTKKIEFVLTLEYGYILEDLNNRTYSIESIKKSDLIFGQREYVKRVQRQSYYDEYYKSPRGIVIPQEDKYRLIDGYHRCLSHDGTKLKVIVAK